MASSQNAKPVHDDGATLSDLGGVLYVNHASMSPWPKATRDAVAAFAETNFREGPMDYAAWLACERALRERVARLLHAGSPDCISLLGNTTDGVNTVAAGMDWTAGDNVVTALGEFPTNRLAWAALARHGVELRTVDLRATDDPEQALAARFDERTRLLTVSSVQWDDGLRLDLPRLGTLCREAGVRLFVDAIQEFGALEMNVETCAIDYLAAGSHKWQMGPEGMGVFYAREGLRQSLGIASPGWRMLDDPYRFDRPDRSPSSTGRRFEGGSPNTVGQIALNASLGVLESEGVASVEASILHNTDQLLAGLSAIPRIQVVSDTRPNRRSGIVSLDVPGGSVSDLHRALKRRRISAALRGPWLRLSPHFYQGEQAMAMLLNAIEDSCNK